MARWTAAALIGGIEVIKLGYISRSSMKSAASHVLLGTQSVKPRDFALQMNLSMENAWGIVRALVDLCKAEMKEDGEFRNHS
jgi:translation initiation factor 3 subunit D